MSNPVLTIRSCDAGVASSEENIPHRDKITVATEKAIQDLLNFISHVVKLIDDDFTSRNGIIQWLEELEEVVGAITDALGADELWAGRDSADSEELENLETVLDEMPSLEDADKLEKIPKSCGRDLLVRLTDFWLQGVRERGYVVHGLLQGSEDCWNIDAALSALAKINYPPDYRT